jgi:hypothetical protein
MPPPSSSASTTGSTDSGIVEEVHSQALAEQFIPCEGKFDSDPYLFSTGLHVIWYETFNY